MKPEDFDGENFKNEELKTGVILLSHPMMSDPNFKRSVILICEHRIDGSVGLVLNDPMDYEVGEVIKELESSKQALFKGGPVQPETLHMIHRLPDRIRDSEEVIEGLSWGGNFEDLVDHLTIYNSDPKSLRLFSGYSGWSKGQLQSEIDEGVWIVAKHEADGLFESPPEKAWKNVLRSMGRKFAILSNFPENPRHN